MVNMVGKVGVKVPDLYELLVREKFVRGVLVSNLTDIWYFPLEDGLEGLLEYYEELIIGVGEGNGFLIKKFPHKTYAISPINDKLYVGLIYTKDKELRSLYVLGSDGWELKLHPILDAHRSAGAILDIAQLGPEFGRKVVVGGSTMVFSDVDGNQLIPFEDFKRKGIYGVDSVVYGDNGGLFLEVMYVSLEHGLVRVVYEDGKFGLGEEILHYDVMHTQKSRTRFLGWYENDTPLVISTVHLNYLVVNNKMVIGSDIVENDDYYTRLVILNNDVEKKLVDVLVGSEWFYDIIYMEINYEDPEKPVVVKTKNIKMKDVITGWPPTVYDLNVVRSKKLHEMLMSLKGKG